MDNNKCRIDDLFFFVFGIDQCADDELKKEKCAEKAYLDLCRTIEYRLNSEKAKKDKGFSEGKEAFRKEIREKIIKSIDGYSNNKLFSDWHKNLCCEIKEQVCDKYKQELFKDNKSLTIGQMQKWINMTIKYEWIMGIIPSEMLTDINDIHIPIDSYIIAAASKAENKRICDGYNVNGLNIKKPIWNWSDLDDYCEYKKYQESIQASIQAKAKMAPIEWESQAWRAEARLIASI